MRFDITVCRDQFRFLNGTIRSEHDDVGLGRRCSPAQAGVQPQRKTPCLGLGPSLRWGTPQPNGITPPKIICRRATFRENRFPFFRIAL